MYLFVWWKARTCLGNGHNQWHPAEAALFCIRAISNYVSTVEAEVMPKVIHLWYSFFSWIFAFRTVLCWGLFYFTGVAMLLFLSYVGKSFNSSNIYYLIVFVFYFVTQLHGMSYGSLILASLKYCDRCINCLCCEFESRKRKTALGSVFGW